MTSPLVPALASNLNLGGPVIKNSMTVGQLRLLARCAEWALTNPRFRLDCTPDEIEEAEALVSMFNDPFLDTAAPDLHHGFCL